MKPKTNFKKEECVASFDIEIAPNDVDAALEEVYGEFARSLTVPGFRPGKAPPDLVKKHSHKEAREEVLKRLISRAYSLALVEHGVHPVALPEITDVAFAEGRALSFKAKVDTKPEVKIKEYKGLKIERKRLEFAEADVEKTLESLRILNAKYLSVEERPLEEGDYAVCDLECFVETKPIHKKREDLWMVIDKEAIIPELTAKMVGMKKLEERECEVTLPEKYPDKKFAGKKAVYKVLLKEIKTRKLPELDDELAKDLGRNNLDELKKGVREELKNRRQRDIEIDMENQLLTKLVSDNVFAVPQSFVARQLQYMVEDFKEKLQAKGFKREDLDARNKEFDAKFADDAARRVRILFILDEIAKKEGIEPQDDELEAAFLSIASQTEQSVEKVKEYYKKEDLIDDLREKIREEKTIRFLLKEANIVEAG